MVETGKMDLKAASLRDGERKALRTFVKRLQQSFPNKIRQVSLFGSKARGDSDDDSDVDVLIIVNQKDLALRRDIIDICSDLSLEYDVLLSPRVIPDERWQAIRNFRFYKNVVRDALPILETENPGF
jgi:predicted nucleotidyltransferase